MDSKTQAEITSMVGVQKFIVDHPGLKLTNPELVIESDLLDTSILDSLAAGNVKGKIEVVNATDVAVAKKEMSDTIMNLLGKGIVKCKQIPKNPSLALKLTRPAEYILKAEKIVAVENANEMIAVMEVPANKTYLSNIKPAEILAAKALVAKYDGIKELPVQTIKNKKDTGTLILEQTVKAGRMNVMNLIVLVKSEYEFSDPNMLTGIVHAATVVILGVRYTPLQIMVKDAASGKLIMDAKSSEQLRKKVRVLYSNVDGLIEQKTHSAGDTTIIFSVPGYEDYELKANIKRKTLNVFEVRMRKII